MWWCNGVEGCFDVVLWWGGGQIGYVFSFDECYVVKFFMLISIWDGDELLVMCFLWQLYVCFDVLVVECVIQLDGVLCGVGFDVDLFGGMGLYWVIKVVLVVFDWVEEWV